MPGPATDARLLKALRENAKRLQAGELARLAGADPEAVPSRIAVLRAAGYAIDHQPESGYRLLAAPDRLIADDIQSRLEPASTFDRITVFAETGSTNDVVTRSGRSGAAPGLAVFAEKQTSGRGRLGRRWESSPSRGLWFSLLLRPPFPFQTWPRLTTCAAVAVAQGIEDAAGCRVAIKWPNDIHLDGKKVAGILTETQFDDAGNPFAVLGIGINVNHDEQDFPEELRPIASSLRLASGRVFDRNETAATVLRRLEAVSGAIGDTFPAILAVARQKSCLLGRRVEIATGGDAPLRGLAEDLDEDGALILRQPGGAALAIRGGEASIVAWGENTPDPAISRRS